MYQTSVATDLLCPVSERISEWWWVFSACARFHWFVSTFGSLGCMFLSLLRFQRPINSWLQAINWWAGNTVVRHLALTLDKQTSKTIIIIINTYQNIICHPILTRYMWKKASQLHIIQVNICWFPAYYLSYHPLIGMVKTAILWSDQWLPQAQILVSFAEDI